MTCVIEQADALVHRSNPISHRDRRVVVERCARSWETGDDAYEEAIQHADNGSSIGLAHVSVPCDADERFGGIHQRHDVGLLGEAFLQCRDERLDGLGEIGEQCAVDQTGERIEGCGSGFVDDLRASG